MYIVWVIMIVIAAFIGAGKNRPVLGVVMGILLGFIGVIIMLFIPSKEKSKGYDESNYVQGRDDKGIFPNQSKPTGAIFKD